MAFFCDICKTICCICASCSEEPETARTSDPLRILLASSDPGELDNWFAELDAIDAEIFRVEDGMAALRALKRQKFDVLIAAVSMAEKDGLELLKDLKQLQRPPLRILVSRNSSNKDHAYLCLARLYGADATLTQPLQNGALGWHVRNTPPGAGKVTDIDQNTTSRESCEREREL